MAPKKKKTKPTANPSRGFATTSIPSRTKPEENADDVASDSQSKSKDAPITSKVPNVPDGNERKSTKDESQDLHQLSPEELEQQLERSELQLLVDKNASKIRQTSSRAATKLITDKRLLRGQAVSLWTKDWLPDHLVQSILQLIQEEEGDTQPSRDRFKKPLISEEDLMLKLWCLRGTLIQSGFSTAEVEDTLEYLAKESGTINLDAQPWGISDALERLAIQCDNQILPPYNLDLSKSSQTSESPSRSETPPLPTETQKAFPDIFRDSSIQAKPNTEDVSSDQPITVDGNDSSSLVESDFDSDLEPEELVSTYIRIKSRLFQRRPDLVTTQTQNKNTKSAKASTNIRANIPLTSDVKKLQHKLQKIESDVLFDEVQADSAWKMAHINLVREDAARRKLRLDNTSVDETSAESESRGDPIPATAIPTGEVNVDSPKLMPEVMDEDDMLGGMFAATAGDSEVEVSTGGQKEQVSTNITIRDFGRASGLSPKRVLEEACKARDPSVKLSFKHVSQTTYASRHALLIVWSKDQDTSHSFMIPGIHCAAEPRRTTVTMTSIATPDLGQSESYVATAALFILFSGYPKEEKAYLRLPPTWRDLWSEFATAKQEQVDAEERETLRGLRDIVRRHTEGNQTEEDDIILRGGFRRRAQNLESGGTSPAPEQDYTSSSEALQQIWRRKSSTSSYQRMLAVRSTLPIANFRDDVLDTIDRNQITIICGETGCGKSTQVPTYILERQLSQGKACKIYCTQPRRISAISLAQRVSEELGENKVDCGTSRSLVGYAIRLESQTTAQTRLVYATVGILLRMFESARSLEEITHLVIDEVHERSIDTDFLFVLLRSLMIERPDLKVILMSATVDADRFSRYLDNAPTLNVPGRTFPVHTKFLEDAIQATGYRPSDTGQDAIDNTGEDSEEDGTGTNNTSNTQNLRGYSNTTINVLRNFDEYRVDYGLIVALLEKVAFGPTYAKFSKAILVFLPGINEIRRLNDMLAGHPRFMQGWLIHPLHSTISSEDQQQAFLIPPQGMRKIVLSTNITETSVTIPDIVCVIDTAKHKEMRYDERRQLSRLTQAFISRANAKQRRGRAGRVQEGMCFHLITKHRHDNIIASQQTPEMLRLSLQELCMRVKICKLGSIEDTLSKALDPPSAKNIRRAIDALIEVNALTSAEELTDLGKQLAKLPLDAHLGKLVLVASVLGCLDFALTIAATLSSKSPFVTPIGQRQRADAVRLAFKKGDSDLLTAYNAYSAWRRVCESGTSDWQFCKKNFLGPQNLASIEDLKAQLLGSLVDAGFVTLNPTERSTLDRARFSNRNRTFVPEPALYNLSNDNEVIVNSVVAWSFYPKLLTRDGKGWRNVANNQSVSLHPTSVNKMADSRIKYLSFYHIMQSSARFTNAHETSPCPDISLVLLAGEADFKLYAGVVVVDGNRLRFMVDDWKMMIVLKRLRERMKEVVDRKMKKPGAALPERLEEWVKIWRRVMSAEGRKLT
ncbi:MAG: hypothetical protein M1821_009577 [Bathelium mastoideum]|nr:MAG: hypothetical protein M1821_009577 [Bathelium mastoideum]